MVKREAKWKGVIDREGGKGRPNAKRKRVGKEKKGELEIQRNLEGKETAKEERDMVGYGEGAGKVLNHKRKGKVERETD